MGLRASESVLGVKRPRALPVRVAATIAAIVQAGAAWPAGAAELALPWLQAIPHPDPQAYLEIGGSGTAEAPTVWVRSGGSVQAELTRFSLTPGDVAVGCLGTHGDRPCGRVPPPALLSAIEACLRTPAVTHYFVHRAGNAVHCLASLPEVAPAGLRQASGVAMLADFEPRWTPQPRSARPYLNELFASAPAWTPADAATAAVACQRPAQAIGAYSSTDFWKDTEKPGVTELSAPHLVWSGKYLVKMPQPFACGAAHYRIDHVGTVLGMLPDGTVLLGGQGTVLRVRLRDGSTEAPRELLRRVAPRAYIEALLQAGGKGCVDNKSPCSWLAGKGQRAAGELESDYAVRWFEGLDRTVAQLFFAR